MEQTILETPTVSLKMPIVPSACSNVMMTFKCWNKRNDKTYILKAASLNDAKIWVVDNLDMTLSWDIVEIDAETLQPKTQPKKEVPNFHMFTVNYIGASNYRCSRIKITSCRFKNSKDKNESITIINNNGIVDAIDFLRSKGFVISGKSEGRDCDYIISDTFKSLLS